MLCHAECNSHSEVGSFAAIEAVCINSWDAHSHNGATTDGAPEQFARCQAHNHRRLRFVPRFAECVRATASTGRSLASVHVWRLAGGSVFLSRR
eukprot:4213140-Prymnesium_polylepis.1